ncbi:MAG: biotin/lipoyl-binding protein [Ktedonobacteraceae bacterium]|nr:biotin/lipoyl-binding protein [Ktedonobacteraceae bacterium]MBO0791536.1 biotin/lipoyl-binding protein [Ktedonobacteraceae bacterium]
MDTDQQYHYNGDADSEEQRLDVTIEHLQRLVQLLDHSDVSEIEIKHLTAGTRLALRKAKAAEGQVLAEGSQLPVEQEAPSQPVETKHTIVAPLVGIFHSWGKPRGSALVAVGDQVKVGQLVGTIQSLNVINEVETSVSGRVSEIFVQNGQPVEYGQPLMAIESVGEA